MQKLEKIYKILFVKLLRVYNLIICKTKQKTAPLEGRFLCWFLLQLQFIDTCLLTNLSVEIEQLVFLV